MYLETLQNLLETESFPPSILRLTSRYILKLVSDPNLDNMNKKTRFDPVSARNLVIQAIESYIKGTKTDQININHIQFKLVGGRTASQPQDSGSQRDPQSSNAASRAYWLDLPQQSIRDALMANRSEKSPILNVHRCVAIAGSTQFLETLWQELSREAQLGDMETCQRLAAFVLTCPQNQTERAPPLLPLFLHRIIPYLLITIDSQLPAEQATNVNLLVSIIISSLTGISHMEWVMRAMEGEIRHILEQSSAGSARSLATELRENRSATAKIILERLASSTTFITNFPMFVPG